MKESRLQKNIINYINSLDNGKAIPITVTIYIEVGTPDIIACVNGQMYLFETKKPGSGLKAERIQHHRIRQWSEAGAVAMKVDSLDEVKYLI